MIAKFFGKVPLRIILILPFVLQIFAAVGLVGYLSFRNGQQSVDDLAAQLRGEIVNRIQERLNSYLNTPHLINQINATDLELGKLDLQDIRGLENHFWQQIQLFDSVASISFGSEGEVSIGVERTIDGMLNIGYWDGNSANRAFSTYATDSRGDRSQLLSEIEDYDLLSRPWYQTAVAAGKPVWGDIYVWVAPYPNVSLPAVLPFYDASRQLIGVFVVDLLLSDISDFLASLKVGRTGQTFIMESNGLLVASSVSQRPFAIENGRRERLRAIAAEDTLIQATATYLRREFGEFSQINRTAQLEFELRGERQLVQVTPYRDRWGLEWTIAVVVPEADFMERINANTRTTIGLCALALGLATLLGIRTSRWITEPILRLNEASRALAGEGLNQIQHTDGDRPIYIRELRVLATSFYQMAKQLRQLFGTLQETNERLEERVRERTSQLASAEAELRGLFEAMTELVIVFDASGCHLKIASINPSLFYNSDTQRLGKRLHDVFEPEVANQFLGYIQQAISSQQTLNVEYCLRVEGAEIWSAASISPISDNSVIWVARNVTTRKQAERAFANQAARDNLLSKISRTFIDKDLSSAIDLTLRLVGEFTKSDRTYVMGYNNSQNQYIFTHAWIKPGIESLSDEVYEMSDESLPWFHQQCQLGQTIQLSLPGDLPAEAVAEKAYIERESIKSLLHVPMLHLDRLVGFIGLDCICQPNDWTPEDIKFLTLVGEIIAMGKARNEVEKALLVEREKSDRLLLNILPFQIANKLKQSQNSIAESFDNVTIMFADIVGFTPLSAKLKPIELVGLLNEIFSQFDELAERLGLEKIKTIGDAYMVAAGLPVPRSDHAEAISEMAIAMQVAVSNLPLQKHGKLQIRIGINSGVVVAGVIGTKKFIYDLWGDAVNVASRMESSGQPGKIQVTVETYRRLQDTYSFEERGKIAVKGKGEMTTYWLTGKK